MQGGTWDADNGGVGRDKHFNHSTSCDKTGKRFDKGSVLRLLADGREIGARDCLGMLKAK